MDVLEKQYTVTVGDVDKTEAAKPSYIFDIFQELTTIHGSSLGIGINEIKDLKMGWVLSRFTVEILRRPKFGETFTASTWPRGPEKLFMLRDYLIKDSSGNVIVKSRSRWIVIDTEKRCPMRPSSLPHPLPLNEGRDALINEGISLKKREGLTKKCSRKASYSDVDFNGHVNNARYIQWLQDALDAVLIENAEKLHIEINYLIEIKLGEPLDIFYGEVEEAGSKILAFEGIKAAGETAFRCEIHL